MRAFKLYPIFILFGFLLVTGISACNRAGNPTNPSVGNLRQELIGKTGKIIYPSFQAEVHYLNDSTIHWKTVDAKGAVAEETEHVSFKKLNDHLYFLNWVEGSGLTVSQVINTRDMEVMAYLTYGDATVPSGRKTEFLHGKFEYITNH